MPISASAKKSLRVSLRRAGENKAMRSRIKNQLKRATPETLGSAFSLLDKAAKNHIIHANKAARLKSRLAKKVATQAVASAVPDKPKTTRKRSTKKQS